jgi:hypothetical protein
LSNTIFASVFAIIFIVFTAVIHRFVGHFFRFIEDLVFSCLGRAILYFF